MSGVSQGNLRTRIEMEEMDSDGRKLAEGFNVMMDEIGLLMEPHFLCNTLECIHWQALSNGNREISTMVKALAQYYRICLSEGKDIIPLGMEPEQLEYINANISDTDREVGYGITNINKRIELMFGEKYGLRFWQNTERGICVEINLPREADEKDMATESR